MKVPRFEMPRPDPGEPMPAPRPAPGEPGLPEGPVIDPPQNPV